MPLHVTRTVRLSRTVPLFLLSHTYPFHIFTCVCRLQPLQQDNMPHPNDAVVSAIEFLADLTVTHTEMGAGKAQVNLGKLISSYCNVHSISIHARYGDDFKSAPLYALITKKSFPMLYDKYHTSLASVDKKVLHVLKNAKSGKRDTRVAKYLIAYQEKQKCLPAMQE